VDIRPATVADAAAVLALKRALDRETSFMLLEPDERTETDAEMAEELRSIAERPSGVVLLADDDGAVVGYVEARSGHFRRNAHRATVVIGVRASHGGRGIGRRLLEELDRWAGKHGISRLELTVMATNERAFGLYCKLGYEVEGTRRAAMLVDGELVDELWMAKLLS
jgi:RimJ/RimL family protein N-acetyltransferase